ncbi:MAG: hypothetical protein V4650_00105 [Pseudomonadota bacterium]
MKLKLLAALAVVVALTLNTTASASPSGANGSVAIVIQTAHTAPPEKAIVISFGDTLLLRTYDGLDARLWRQPAAETRWELLHHWKNLSNAWLFGDERLAAARIVHGSFSEGLFELHDGITHRRRLSIPMQLAADRGAYSYYSASTTEGWTIIGVDALDAGGEETLHLFFARDGKDFTLFTPTASGTAIQMVQLFDGEFAVQIKDGRWRFVTADASGKTRPLTLPGATDALDDLDVLEEGLLRFPTQSHPGAAKRWHLLQRTTSGWRDALVPLKLDGAEVTEIAGLTHGFVRIVLANNGQPEQDGAFRTRYFLRQGDALVPVNKVIEAMPAIAHEFKVLALGRLVGATAAIEFRAGSPAPWVWRLRDPAGRWQAVERALPGAPEVILDAVEWNAGLGLGLRSARAPYAWSWYSRDAASETWQPVAAVMPSLAGLNLAMIVDHRDGLIEITESATLSTAASASKHWFMRGSDGVWSEVRKLVKAASPGAEPQIVAVDARRDGLMIDLKAAAAEPVTRLVLYRHPAQGWQKLDEAFYSRKPRLASDAGRLFPLVSALTQTGPDWLLLTEADDADWDGQKDESLLLQRGANGWTAQAIDAALGVSGAARIRYSPDRQLMIREGASGAAFFLRDAQGRWADVRIQMANAPKAIETAYVFAAGQGLALREAADADGNGRHGEWQYWLKDGAGYQPVSSVLPGAFPRLASLVGEGAVVTLFEEGDADGDGTSYERISYLLRDGRWLSLASLWNVPAQEVSELRLSADGGLLSAREERDANGNGRAFELLGGLWSGTEKRYLPLPQALDLAAERHTRTLTSIWGGKGLLLGQSGSAADTVTSTSALTSDTRTVLYEADAAGRFSPVVAPAAHWLELRAGESPRVVAVRTASGWQLLGRGAAGQPLTAWTGTGKGQSQGQEKGKGPNKPILDVRFAEGSDAAVYLKTADRLRGGREVWERWTFADTGLARKGIAASPLWFGIAHAGVGMDRIAVTEARHFVDGIATDTVPEPVLWLHANPAAPASAHSLFAPDLLRRALSAPVGQPQINASVEALGIGPKGRVLIYRNGPERIAAAFSNGQVWLESRTLVAGGGSQPSEVLLLGNRFADGSERLARFDAPDRGLWALRERGGGVYYDDRGYFYNDSEAITSRMTFRVGEALHSFSQLGSYLFRPDLLEERLGLATGTLFELTPRDRERLAKARTLAPQTVDVAGLIPPSITVTLSERPQTSAEAMLQIAARGFGIAAESIDVRIIGAGQARAQNPIATGNTETSVELTRRVPLIAGSNTIEVIVQDARGLSHSQRIEAEYRPEQARKPRLFAALIATADYRSGEVFSSLPLTQNDATTMRNVLATQNAQQFSEVKLRTWCQQAECTSPPERARILTEVPLFFAEAETGDYLLVYISGHGLKLDTEYFMVPTDGSASKGDTLVSWSQIQAWLRASAPGKKMVVLDTCHAGAALENQGDKLRLVRQAAEYDGIYILSATAADAKAYEMSDLGNGLFTYVLNQGLSGAADGNADGRVSFEELSIFVGLKVGELSSARRTPMRPDVPLHDAALDFVVARVKELIRLDVRVSDRSSFDDAPLSGRRAHWASQMSAKADIVVGDETNAPYRLVIIEDQAKPLRAQLAQADGLVIQQWQLADLSEASLVSEVQLRLRASHAGQTRCGNARGVDKRTKC